MEFSATITAIHSLTDSVGENCFGVELDRTAFFPEGGGQKGDSGYIDTMRVFDTQVTDDGKVLHYVRECPTCEVGAPVTGKLDEAIRFERMQMHGAEHLLCGLIHNKFGYENSGFHMNEDGVIFDVDGPLTESDIRGIEEAANELVYQNLPITVSFPTEDEAKILEYRSKLDTYDNIRLVTIQGIDVCACCAPQLASTGLIGIIKIIDYMPHRQGMRLTMLAGRKAYNDYVSLHNNNAKIMAYLSSKREDTAAFTGDFLDRFAKIREENTSLKKEMVNLLAEKEIAAIKAKNQSGSAAPNEVHVIFSDSIDTTGLRNLINLCIKECGGIIAGFCKNDAGGYNYIIGKAENLDTDVLPKLAKQLNEQYCGRGGGSVKMVQGSIANRPICDKIML